ncbi:META domain-containing protein [Methylocystis heyeri]|uniref:META domain-containing protein n=1 Tax=Methylocystis heyeri TaxID=391905 RepID=A0A6B8KFQ3_9HYPH|nr:META domain-containing protein [Methylocystis heyeri]QGM45815.1 META domain-containing protein [Methylocystis heyeri]
MRVSPILAALFLALSCAHAETLHDLAGNWRLERLSGAADFDRTKTRLQIAADGAVSTTVGCNRASGKARIEGDKVSFGHLAATRMACPPELAGLEFKYFAALEAARSLRLEDSLLALLNERGEEIAAFIRQ